MSVSTIPIEEPITGRGELTDITEPKQALVQFYKALNGRDLALMEQNWDSSADAVMDNPLGGIKSGWAAIRRTYEELFSTRATFSFEFWDAGARSIITARSKTQTCWPAIWLPSGGNHNLMFARLDYSRRRRYTR
jgi:hypothetical protein